MNHPPLHIRIAARILGTFLFLVGFVAAIGPRVPFSGGITRTPANQATLLFEHFFRVLAHTARCVLAGAVILLEQCLSRVGLPRTPYALGLTLTSPQVLLDIIQTFAKKFPALNRMGMDWRASPLKLNQQYIAHIAGLPTASTYDSSTGYANGANAARSLLTDVPVTVDAHPTCPLKWLHLDEIKDIKLRYDECIANAGYVLAKGAIDALLAKATTRYFSRENVTAVADCDYEWLMTLTGLLNAQGALNTGRVLLVSTAVANVLAVDPRMVSKDFAGQLLTGEGYRMWTNVGGFAMIQEYPDLPSNNGSQLTGVTGANSGDLMTKVAHGLETGDPVTFISGTTFTGLTAGTRYWAIKADADTFQVASSYANAIAGTEVTLSADGTSGVFQKQENLVAFAFDRRAFAFLGGVPDGFSSELIGQLGIPQVMGMDRVTDPDTGITMGAAKWQAAGTGDLFWCPTFVYGSHAGKQGDATTSVLAAAKTAGTACDYAGLRVSSGASS